MHKNIQGFSGANMDIDLATPAGKIGWKQDPCPWNSADGCMGHKCAVKNISLCPYFCGVDYPDTLLCCYPNANPMKSEK